MKTTIINFVAGPGAGKSLMSALTFAELKSMHLSCELVQEYAKILVWQERYEELNCQWQVSREQYNMLKAIDGKVEYICTDSPLLLGLVYNRTYKTNVSNVEKTEAMILKNMSQFNNVYIFLERGDFPFEMIGRVHTEDESHEIDRALKVLLDDLGIEYLTIKSHKNSIPEIVKYVKHVQQMRKTDKNAN